MCVFMTTVLGLKHPDVKTAILVADRQATTIDERTGFPDQKYLGRKLWSSADGNFCFGHSGKMDQKMEDFVQALSNGKFDVENIINKGNFSQLRKLNIERMGKRLPDLGQLSGIVLATRFNQDPRLYTCFPLGNVEERVWTSIGSGEERVTEYMNALNVIGESRNYLGNGTGHTTQSIIQIGLEAVRRAQSRDLYSHGLDMMVCTSDEIRDHFAELGDDFGAKLKKIQRQYKPKKD